jgi:hypothetical protein
MLDVLFEGESFCGEALSRFGDGEFRDGERLYKPRDRGEDEGDPDGEPTVNVALR